MPILEPHVFSGKVVIVGVGNPLRGDDGAGPALVERLKGRVRATCLDAGSSPEAYSGAIAREAPETIVLVDAVHLGRHPGEWELLDASEISHSGLTTHDLSLTFVVAYLMQRTQARVYLLGVQPKSLALGEGLSAEVQLALGEMAQALEEALHA